MKFISGKDKDTFTPDENITINDCLVILLYANIDTMVEHQQLLGAVETSGGYPYGYYAIVKENGIITDELPDKAAIRGDVVCTKYGM